MVNLIMKKYILTFLAFIISIFVFSQENSVIIVGFGDGNTKDKATNAALRHCIEKTFGVFVSTNSLVVNNELVKDEIATLAIGNIISYDVISEIQRGENYSVTVAAVVSPDNIVKSFKNKGYLFEINGGVYAQNIQKEKFYKEQEPKIIKDFLQKYIEYPIFDTFEIKIGDPFRSNKNLAFRKEYFRDSKQAVFTGIGFKDISDVVDESSLKKIYNILPNNLFMIRNRENPYNELHKWESVNGTKVEKIIGYGGNSDVWSNPKIETYIIPIIYSPHYNEENASKLSEILSNFFNKISIKNIDYESKYGETYTASLCLLKEFRNKKGIFKGSTIDKQRYKLRNLKSIEILNEFSESIGKKSNPNSLDIENFKVKLELNSGWFFQPFQNYTNPHGFNNIFDKFNQEVFQVNLANGIGSSQDVSSTSAYYSYSFRPCLLLLNISVNELPNLNKLEFKWK